VVSLQINSKVSAVYSNPYPCLQNLNLFLEELEKTEENIFFSNCK
jgi:hypothetical protein